MSAVVLVGGKVLGSGSSIFNVGSAGGGTTPVFNLENFSGSPAVHPNMAVAISGDVVNMTNGISHMGGGLWWDTVQNIQSFTTEFVFQVPGAGNYGIFFVVQNSNSTTNPTGSSGGAGGFGLNAGGNSANGCGYGAGGGADQPALGNSVGLGFLTNGFNNEGGTFISPAPVSTLVLCVDGGPAIGGNGPAAGFAAVVDVHPFGINLGSNNPIQCVVTYDGTILTLVATDTVASTTVRQSWPINIPAIVGANTAIIGFTSASPLTTGNKNTLNSWSYSTGINTRLAAPTFSVTPGHFTSAQSVFLSGPSGATIYYTTNGMTPTPGGTGTLQYTGTPITVSSSAVLSAVAVQSNFTDSIVAQGLYLIQASATPTINFPSGFASANGLVQVAGNASISGGDIVLTDTLNGSEAAAAWFAVPVPITTFSTTFTLDLTSVQANGMCWVLQNYPQTTTGTNFDWNLGNGPNGVTVVSGGPWTLSGIGDNLGYTQIFNSICVAFDFFTVPNSVGLYLNGAEPVGSQVALTGGVSYTTATPITVTITYNGTALTMTMTQGSNTFTTTLSSSINIPALLGANVAYAGFTAATGGETANVKISQWSM
jgi:hypothetical protein